MENVCDLRSCCCARTAPIMRRCYIQSQGAVLGNNVEPSLKILLSRLSSLSVLTLVTTVIFRPVVHAHVTRYLPTGQVVHVQFYPLQPENFHLSQL